MRRELDRYYTPDTLARQCLELHTWIEGRVLEPHVGGGAFARALAEHKEAELTVGDIDPDAPGLALSNRSYVGDFLEVTGGYDWVIGNPPYRHAELHVRHALRLATRVGFLLRLAFLESQRRRPLWNEHPPSCIWVLSKRPSFTSNNRTDATAYAWFFWEQGEYDTRVRWL
jgi:hypothetical protein